LQPDIADTKRRRGKTGEGERERYVWVKEKRDEENCLFAIESITVLHREYQVL
jgi:hypothetical protein